MDFKVLKWQILRGTLARRLLLKIFLFAMVMAIISFIQIARDVQMIEPVMLNFNECPLNVGSNPYMNFTGFPKPVSDFAFPLFWASLLFQYKESEDLTVNMFKELMAKDLLDSGAKALFVGEGSASAVLALQELGFSNAFAVNGHPFFSLLQNRFVCELDFKDDNFNFVFSRALDKVSVPALLVLEIERVLRPGGIGAMLVGVSEFYSGSLVRSSATLFSSFLRTSNVLHTCGIGSFTLVIFKKRFHGIPSLEHYPLPDECPSIANNKPLMKYIEPLADEKKGQLETEVSYLPKFMNISSRNRLIYINIGAGEFVKSSVAKLLKPHYPIPHKDYNVFVIDHNTTILSSYMKNPGIKFVYHPVLAGEILAPSLNSDEYPSAPLDDEEEKFDFIHWFRETIADGDFVILMINARLEELNILIELFKTGEICHVDELFLRCSDRVDCKNAVCEDCMSLFRSLRNSGVFVHQW